MPNNAQTKLRDTTKQLFKTFGFKEPTKISIPRNRNDKPTLNITLAEDDRKSVARFLLAVRAHALDVTDIEYDENAGIITLSRTSLNKLKAKKSQLAGCITSSYTGLTATPDTHKEVAESKDKDTDDEKARNGVSTLTRRSAQIPWATKVRNPVGWDPLILAFTELHTSQCATNNDSTKLNAATTDLNDKIQKLCTEKYLTKLESQETTEGITYKLHSKLALTQTYNEATGQLNFQAAAGFTGIITVQRMKDNGDLIPGHFDHLLFQNGTVSDIALCSPAPTQQNCRIFTIAQEFFKEHDKINDMAAQEIYTRKNAPDIQKNLSKYQQDISNKSASLLD